MDGRDFTQQMQKLSDEELVEIVSFSEKDSYLPEAIEAARQRAGRQEPEFGCHICDGAFAGNKATSRREPTTIVAGTNRVFCSSSWCPVNNDTHSRCLVSAIKRVQAKEFRGLEVDGTGDRLLDRASHSYCYSLVRLGRCGVATLTNKKPPSHGAAFSLLQEQPSTWLRG